MTRCRDSHVALMVVEETSLAYKLGIREGHIGAIMSPYGLVNCCEDPTGCLLVQFINDSGMCFNMCAPDDHFKRLS